MLLRLALLIILIPGVFHEEIGERSLEANKACTANRNCAYLDNDELISALTTLHKKLDDDANGNIDRAESVDFLHSELEYKPDSGEDRQRNFHANWTDSFITVDELINKWKQSIVHNWSKEEVATWLSNTVRLEKYVPNFLQANVNGSLLPRIAVNTNDFLGSELKIRDPIHKNRIMLRAIDVVLFGPSDIDYLRMYKDAGAVFLLFVLISSGLWMMRVKRLHSEEMSKLSNQLELMQKAEDDWNSMRSKLDRSEKDRKNFQEKLLKFSSASSEDGSESNGSLEGQLDYQKFKRLESELEETKASLRNAEDALKDFKQLGTSWTPPDELIPWLQLTYEIETQTYRDKRTRAEKQLQEAREACEGLRKRKGVIFSTLRTGTAVSSASLDKQIADAKASLVDLMDACRERVARWTRIEDIMKTAGGKQYLITYNRGTEYLRSTLYTRVPGGGLVARYAATSAAATAKSSLAVTGSIRNSITTPNLMENGLSNSASNYTARNDAKLDRVNGNDFNAFDNRSLNEVSEDFKTDDIFEAIRPA